MTYDDLRAALRGAVRDHPPYAADSSPFGRVVAPWPVLVRLPDGTICDVTDVRANPVEVILDVTPRRTP